MSRSRVTWFVPACLAAVLVGCSGNTSPQVVPTAGWGDVGPDSVSGTVRQVGNLPFSRTLVDGGDDQRVFVTGELESEIARLAGMEVRVTGSFTEGDQPGQTVQATSYEILGAEEERPAVGILGRDDQGFYVATFDEAKYRLSQIPAELEEAMGARVWVVAAEGEHVLSYGILREASE